jgi:hypothetical protein
MEHLSFNAHTHVPPAYDIAGYLKPEYKRRCQFETLNNNDESIPKEWIHRTNTNASGVATRSELMHKRKIESLPDKSYDLDGDGVVGGRDMVIAKLYDKDGDGKLNDVERKEALDGIKRGVEGNYVWNVTRAHYNSGSERGRRVKSASNGGKGGKQQVMSGSGGVQPFRHFIQVRGKVIEAENFQPIIDTYPIHPMSKCVPRVSTLSELKHKRKETSLSSIAQAIELWERQHPSLFKEQIPLYETTTTTRNAKQLHSSRSEIKLRYHKEARIRCGLSPEETDIGHKTISPPTLAYVYDPKHKTKTDMLNDIKASNSSKCLINPNYQNEQQRLNSREDEIFNKLSTYNTTTTTNSDNKRKTCSAIRLSRKAELNKLNAITFNKETHGIHGHDLPKYAQSKTMNEFWKNDEHYCNSPKHSSLVEYKESIKYWKPSEEMLLNEHRDGEVQQKDPFKCEYHPIDKNKKYNEMVIKVNNVNHYKGFDPTVKYVFDGVGKNTKCINKWTTIVNQFAPNRFKDGRMFDDVKQEESKIKKGKASDDGVSDTKEVRPSSTKNVFKRGNFFVNQLKETFKGKINWMKNEREKEEMYKCGKNSLYNKFAKEDTKKGSIPRGAVTRDKGF